MKAKRGGGGGHHGGSWKVALADFAIAMMALFLLLWVLNATDDDTKSAIAAYFEDPGAFRHQTSLSPIDFGGQDSLVEIPNPGLSMRGREGPEIMSDGNAETLNEDPDFKDLMDELQRLIGGDDSTGEYEDFIYLERLQEGLRIVILDNDKRNMFERGSSRLNHFFQDLLLELAPILNKVNHRIMISGHTDNSGFQRLDYGNWELSTARAQVARRTMTFGGYSENKILMVLGMADRVPRDPDNPQSSANRRIEILVLAEYMERQVERMFAPVDEEDLINHPANGTEMYDALDRATRNQLYENAP
ncbi:flagellar motor protein MotB [uncultured Endozoicomonas sp.]|uniref:flagellar motor protein MotB n=1 Tax=uncultured Endozoicomonas sp. TaxID=432652 RepID=UPI00260CC027|nr:flagellar motor protein MotB [uncultured Endozoicomonas sp.]